MRFKKLNMLLLLFLGISMSTLAQSKKKRIDEEFPTPIAFPFEFFGDYAGNLRVSDNTGTLANIPTELSLTKTDIDGEFEYTIVFLNGKDKEQLTHRLFTIDQEKGFYAIKDNQGLEFTAILIDGILHSMFEVNDMLLFTTLQFTNDEKVRLTITRAKKILNSRTKKLKEDQAKSSNVVLVQKALLSKVRN
ncbi:hypothetical protein G5B37_01620 [Rasiella rasia]|uniref:Uncharacterized protein n=1 Tax=Rasiella rasia TaxID=2744027 RepID=A0A6G6GKU4_9FLAO|nr:hypothetical protein [Rasiella rasia]QIE58311.1 hypothetical protein G5B37_01620 [Rasiella rasia]